MSDVQPLRPDQQPVQANHFDPGFARQPRDFGPLSRRNLAYVRGDGERRQLDSFVPAFPEEGELAPQLPPLEHLVTRAESHRLVSPHAVSHPPSAQMASVTIA